MRKETPRGQGGQLRGARHETGEVASYPGPRRTRLRNEKGKWSVEQSKGFHSADDIGWVRVRRKRERSQRL